MGVQEGLLEGRDGDLGRNEVLGGVFPGLGGGREETYKVSPAQSGSCSSPLDRCSESWNKKMLWWLSCVFPGVSSRCSGAIAKMPTLCLLDQLYLLEEVSPVHLSIFAEKTHVFLPRGLSEGPAHILCCSSAPQFLRGPFSLLPSLLPTGPESGQSQQSCSLWCLPSCLSLSPSSC